MKGMLYALLCVLGGFFLPFLSVAQPIAGFSSNITAGCPPIVVNFTDQSTGSPTSWYWNLGNGTTSTLQNPSTTYLTAGTYTISLTVANSLGSNTTTMTGYIKVAAAPAVSFTGDSSVHCGAKTIAFTNNSTPGGTGTPSYLWDFGDGNTSTLQNPTHTYTVASNYSVSLVITNSNGCTNTLTKANYVKLNPKPLIGFTASNTASCSVPHTSTFINTSTGGSSYLWHFGDGSTSTLQSPSHTYTTAGAYTVKLIVTTATGCKDSLVKTAYINAGTQQATFTSNATGCVGSSMSFTNTTTPTASSYAWQFGNSATSTAQSPNYTYTTAGTYNVRLIANYASCSDTAYKTITIGAKPKVQFTANATTSCVTPFAVSFNNTTTGAASYLWKFGDGGTGTSATPTYTYNNIGNHTVRLISTTSLGCQDSLTRSSYIKISKPSASITATPLTGCIPATTLLTANISSAVPVTGYSWDYGDGSPVSSCSSCSTQTHTYTTAGTYTAKLTFTTSTGCSTTVQKVLNYGNQPTAAFSASDTSVCPGTAVSFINASTGANSYVWLFDDNTTSTQANPTKTYNRADAYSVSLVAINNGCTDTVKKHNYINVLLPEAKFKTSFNCASRKTVTFADSSRGANTYFWKFGDGSTATTSGTVTHTYTTYGTYTAKLTVTNTATGCTHTSTSNLDIYGIAPQFAVNDSTACHGSILTFGAAVSNNYNSYTWRFGDGASQSGASVDTAYYAYPDNGTYSVKLIVADKNGCKDSVTKTAYVKVTGPVANFSATPVGGCVPLNASFTDASTANGGAIAARAWDFGNGSNTATNNTSLSKQYTTAGTFTVKLNLTDINGCTDSLIRTDYISVTKPTAAFTTPDTNVCGSQNVTFANASLGSSLSYKWSFGDGASSTSAMPSHAYNSAGQYPVKLVITDANGCKDSIIKNALVKVSIPKPIFTMSDSFATCPPLIVNFDNKSTGAASYYWSFGNNSTSILDTPATVYTYPGTYKVKLIAITANGCKDSTTKTVNILGPTGTFTYNVAGCLPLTVNFSANAKNTAAYIWDMNNGVTKTTTTASTSFTYQQSGKYVPKLILSDGGSCMVPIQGKDTVMADSVSGDFNFSANAALCQSGTVYFKDTIYHSIYAVTSRQWNFGDGGTSTAHNPSHKYNAPGAYTVRLIIGNNISCKDTILKTVTIHPNPAVNAGNNIAVCAGTSTPVTLSATGATKYTWSPPSGMSCDTCSTTSLIPVSTGTYIVIGTDSNGCKDTASVTITVRSKPNISAGADKSVCEGASITLHANGGTTYNWSPATTLSCATCADPVATPSATTAYVVTGTDSNGCVNTDTVLVTVNAKPVVNAGADKQICIGSAQQLMADGADSYEWTPATGLSCANCADPVANPTTTTTYTVIGTSSAGCKDTDEVLIVVNTLPTVTATNASVCSGASATLTATGATSYSWFPSTGLSCDTCSKVSLTPTSTGTYIVIGTDANGCKDTASATVTVLPKPGISAGADQSICEGASTSLQASGGVSYVWSPSTGLSCTNCSNPAASPATTTTYVVTGTDVNGCINTDTVSVTVNTKPVVNAGADKKLCSGGAQQMSASGAATYEWSPAIGLSCKSCASPIANPTATTIYTVVGTSIAGCKDTDEVVVIVNPLPNVVVAGATICEGNSVTLNATGAVTYDWSPSNGLSCNNCANPIASPLVTTNYIITGTDMNGCVASTQAKVTVNMIPVVNAGKDTTICEGAQAQPKATGASAYVWTPATNLSCSTCANPFATPIATTAYVVNGTVNGCSKTDTVIVKVLPKPVITAGKDVEICAGTSVTLHASGAATYNWAPTANLSCTNCPVLTVAPPATTKYLLTGVDSNGCGTTTEVTVKVNSLPIVDAGADKELCEKASVSLEATGATKYKWSAASTLSCTTCSNPTATPDTNIVYKVIGTDAHGCSDSDDVAITIIQKKETSVGNGDTICKGGKAMLSATGGTRYLWFPAGGLNDNKIATPVAMPLHTTAYQLEVKQGHCFTDTFTVTVVVKDNPIINAGEDIYSAAGYETKIKPTSTGATKYIWSPGNSLSCDDCESPIAKPGSTTTYKVIALNEWGCQAEDEITIHTTCGQDQLFIANTFTPNGDGSNDYFFPQGRGIQQAKRFRVYNRWGELLFDRQNMPLNDELAGWDGTYKGQSLKPDVFVYILNAVCESGEPIEMKGDISLIR
ncbi:MAG: PKD domain-containing protein [Sphingobacteriales bacterium]|nr:MAG: PKD domain-containing protein [Sphingobacteriales bacterium]